MLLEGKRVIVTGGITGIGRATVLAMVRHGARVVSMSRTAPADDRATSLVAAADAIASGSVIHVRADVSDETQVENGFVQAVDFLGGLDVLVGSAGLEQVGAAETLTAADHLRQLTCHAVGTAVTNVAAFRRLKDKGGSIVNSSSIAGAMGLPGMSAYSAAKGAVLAYSRAVAQEWGPYGIRVNAVAPAAKTEMYDAWWAQQTPEQQVEILKAQKRQHPLRGEPGTPEDSANVYVFLASDLSAYMTGQLIPIDGGMMMTR